MVEAIFNCIQLFSLDPIIRSVGSTLECTNIKHFQNSVHTNTQPCPHLRRQCVGVLFFKYLYLSSWFFYDTHWYDVVSLTQKLILFFLGLLYEFRIYFEKKNEIFS